MAAGSEISLRGALRKSSYVGAGASSYSRRHRWPRQARYRQRDETAPGGGTPPRPWVSAGPAAWGRWRGRLGRTESAWFVGTLCRIEGPAPVARHGAPDLVETARKRSGPTQATEGCHKTKWTCHSGLPPPSPARTGLLHSADWLMGLGRHTAPRQPRFFCFLDGPDGPAAPKGLLRPAEGGTGAGALPGWAGPPGFSVGKNGRNAELRVRTPLAVPARPALGRTGGRRRSRAAVPVRVRCAAPRNSSARAASRRRRP